MEKLPGIANSTAVSKACEQMVIACTHIAPDLLKFLSRMPYYWTCTADNMFRGHTVICKLKRLDTGSYVVDKDGD